MIEKKLHYCWFGKNEKSELIKRCIETWKKYLPDYEIIEWNESNFDIEMIKYTSEAYAMKKYAFVSDYARLWIIYNYGGIYVDTDVEILKPLDILLEDKAFMATENRQGVNLGLIFASEKKNPILLEIMNYYESHNFILSNDELNQTTIIKTTTDILKKYGYSPSFTEVQNIKDIIIYPPVYFCPDRVTREKRNFLEQTYTVHHYEASWVDPAHKKRLNNFFWNKSFILIIRLSSCAKKILGEERWIVIRNKYFKSIYKFVKGERNGK